MQDSPVRVKSCRPGVVKHPREALKLGAAMDIGDPGWGSMGHLVSSPHPAAQALGLLRGGRENLQGSSEVTIPPLQLWLDPQAKLVFFGPTHCDPLDYPGPYPTQLSGLLWGSLNHPSCWDCPGRAWNLQACLVSHRYHLSPSSHKPLVLLKVAWFFSPAS